MTDLEVFKLYKDQYEAIDGNLQHLRDEIKQQVPVEQLQSRLMQLALAWDQAHLNYIKSGNKIFDSSKDEIKKLTEGFSDAQESMKESLADLKQVAKTLDQITNAVAVATSLLGLATPKIA